MTDDNRATRKRELSESPEPAKDGGFGALSNKRRFILDNEPLQTTNDRKHLEGETFNALDVLAQVAAAAPRLPIVRNRKRVILKTPTPPPQVKTFNLLTGLVSHVDILLQVTSYLPPKTLLNLYSISAPFHYVMDSHFTAFIKAATHTWAPDADRYFPWWCYRQLCIEDPALRRARPDRRSVSWNDFTPKPESDTSSQDKFDGSDTHTSNSGDSPNSIKSESQAETKARVSKLVKHRQTIAAPVPGFRWLKMVVYRESVCREIVGWLAAHGHRIPRLEGVDALKKMWFLLDVPVNGPRIALIHNTIYFTKETLAVLQLFFIKLDMLYCNPVHFYGGEASMREMLLAERSLTTLWNYLRGADGTSKLDTMRLWIRHRYKRPQPIRPMTREAHEEHLAKLSMPIMGVPAQLVGRWGYECWGLGQTKLLRPDELVLKEAVRRRAGLQRMFLSYLSYGYLDADLNPLPTNVKPEDVVLSMIRRKKHRELKAKESDGMDIDKKEEDEKPAQGQSSTSLEDRIRAMLAERHG
ncbi:hypothetical protein D6D23_05563 [Aureobasidium pullulans]|uniref:F-box domain-containing protein n=1 Tax=Aureobasidium pullulans TaxID=5580 RepID=A0A4S8SM56_AURPU|nr:hypothetical protein D6D28_04064 [Aureobasidium pullulans]THW23635.1 hypothetical protein D6D23_05563 [Aureobasidium pullulans]THY21015.1 hypothetical protein D6D00_07517 [Aureobasidium pullulans]